MVARTHVISIQSPQGQSLRIRGLRLPLESRIVTPGRRAWLFLLVHFLLGWSIARVPELAQLQLGLVVALGLWWALVRPSGERMGLIAAYLAGAEVLWRMTGVGPLWEFGKYGLIILLGLSLVRAGRLQAPLFALGFFATQLPSTVLPLASLELMDLRNDLSFYLSGPLALTVCTWFFSALRLRSDQVQELYYALLGPVITLGAVTLFGTLTAEKLRFTNNSNFATSGGFGPNQVSAALGLGIVIAFLAFQNRKAGAIVKLWLLVIMLFLTVQCAMTFSRSGIYMAAGAMVAGTFYLVRERRFLGQLAAGVGILILAINFLVLPRLEKMTGGRLTDRFANTRLTGRDRLILADLQAFADHPVFGVGPGQGRHYRQKAYDTAAAHTEFTRLLGEHGLFGVLAIALLLMMSVQHIRRKGSPGGKAHALSLIAWSFLFMTVSAMRLAAPAFAFGLAAITIIEDDPRPRRRW
jgi:hypothetical protein